MSERTIVGTEMEIETPNTFSFRMPNHDQFVLELEAGRWVLHAAQRVEGKFAPDCGSAKMSRWDAVKAALEKLEALYA